jgi:hypothetical protein
MSNVRDCNRLLSWGMYAFESAGAQALQELLTDHLDAVEHVLMREIQVQLEPLSPKPTTF